MHEIINTNNNSVVEQMNTTANSMREILRDHALRIYFINKCLVSNKIDSIPFEHTDLSKEEMKSWGFSDEKIIQVNDRNDPHEKRNLSLINQSNSIIKGR